VSIAYAIINKQIGVITMKNTIDYDLPYKWNYYKEGSNSSAVAFRDENSGFTYFYSYNTLVAFEHTLSGLVVRENVWGVTTGKHLNAIDGGSVDAKIERVTYYEDFKKKLEETQTQSRETTVKVAALLKELKDKETRDKRLAERIKLNSGYSKAGH
jgi:hypothetical protein